MYDNKKLNISSEHFNTIEKIAQLGSWKIDLKTSMVYSTAEARRIYGVDRDEMSLEDIKTVPLPEYRKLLDSEMEQLLAGTKTYDLEFRIKRVNDGRIRYVHSVAEYDPDEGIVTGCLQDITDRKLIELKLADSENRFRGLFENSSSGIIYASVDGTIVEINQRMLHLLGSPSVEKTKEINVLVFPLLVEVGFSDDFRKSSETGKDVLNSVNYRSAWGTEHFLEYHLTPIKRGENVIGVMGKFEDITERVQARSRIESLLKEKDIILREVHHRMKNNMASIEALLQLQIDSSEHAVVGSALKEAITRIGSMRILYEKLYQADDFLETSSDTYLSKLIDDIAEVFPQSGKIRISKKIEEFAIPAKIGFSLGIIINEVLTNSMKYAFGESDKDCRIEVTAEKKDVGVFIRISDNGRGFPDFSDVGNQGFGYQLIEMLSIQIGAETVFGNDNGAVFTIAFEL